MCIVTILTTNRTDCCLINFFVPILCCYFAHDYRNRPFCSPAFFIEFFIHFLTIVCNIIYCPQHIIDFHSMNFKPFSVYNPIYFLKFSIYIPYIFKSIFYYSFSYLYILLSDCLKLPYFSIRLYINANTPPPAFFLCYTFEVVFID